MTPRIVPLPTFLLFWCAAFTLGHFIFIRRPLKDHPVILAHETIHVMQYRREGLLKFLFLYLFCFPVIHNPWRARWEAEAYAVSIRGGYTEDHCVGIISGWRGLWACRPDRARALLKEYAR